MNFLAHYVLAVRTLTPAAPLPLYAMGNALPDILPLAPPRRRLKPQRLSLPPATAEHAALRAGVRAHLATDTAFHKTAAFGTAQSVVSQLLDNVGFVNVRVRNFFAAHVLAEMALDAALLRREPTLADAFYNALGAADVALVTEWAEGIADAPLPGLPDVLTRFVEFPYLHSYKDDAGVAEGFNRLCARARQDTFDGDNWERLLLVTAQTVGALDVLADALLSETARGIQPSDGAC